MKTKTKKYPFILVLMLILVCLLQFTIINLKWLDILALSWYYVLSPMLCLWFIIVLGFIGLIVLNTLIKWGLGD